MGADLCWRKCDACGGPSAPVGAPALSVTFDCETRNELNGTTARWQKANRRTHTREATEEALSIALGEGQKLPAVGPWLVRLTRLSPGELDDDAIPGALKSVRDIVAAAIGVDDKSPAYAWTYAQAHRREMGVRIEVWARVEVSS